MNNFTIAQKKEVGETPTAANFFPRIIREFEDDDEPMFWGQKMDTLELDKIEGQFGLVLRDKDNHSNYVLIRFEDLQKIVQYFDKFKEETKFELS